MKPYHLVISTPDGSLFDGEAGLLALRGADGDLAVLAGHIPMMTAIRPGSCKVVLPDETERTGTVDGGLLTVSEDCVTVISGSFTWDK